MDEINIILESLGPNPSKKIIGMLLYELGQHCQSLKMTEANGWNPSGTDLDKKAKQLIESRDLLISIL